MCGRGSLNKVEKDLEKRFNATFYSDDLERYNPLPTFNLAPTQWHPVITQHDPQYFQYFKWGLIPSWSKDHKIGSKLINARVEGLIEKPFFKSALKDRRCIIPLDGFYEWKVVANKIKKPYRIRFKDDSIFFVAGLYDQWKNEKAEIIHSFTIITQKPNPYLSSIHDRMPAILQREQESLWLDPLISLEQSLQLITPLAGDYLDAYPVSDAVNQVKNNNASLIEKLDESDSQSLF
ncbi:MAG: SOS response-associated peptidase [Saprospiraceae bacterium]|jgi:putative SOS response-associated peptidase YedK|nr:SOS response-associated peptidase [Saprospiraceae bacterium]